MQDPPTPHRPSGDPTPAAPTGDPASATAAVRGQVQEAANRASSLVGQVKDRAVSAAEERKAGIVDGLEEAAQAVQRSGEQLRGKQDWLAGAVDRGAAELSAFAASLRDKDLGTLVGEVQGFARRQPAAFIGISFAAGFALARLGRLVAADATRDDLPSLPEIRHGQA